MFERHGRMVYGVCRAILRDSHDAEDATQQTFLSAYRSLLGGAHVRDDGAWLATIARNESRARIAAGMRTPLPVADEDLAAIPERGDEPERRAQAAALREALGELPERQREAVVLRHLYGLSYGEVGTALGLSRPATEALLFRARRAMRTRLRPVVATAIVVPLSVQESLAQAIPGFGAAGAGAFMGGAAGGGLLAKLVSAPAAAKVATAAVAVTTLGAVGSIESERAGRDRAEHGGIVTIISDRDSSGSRGVSGRSDDRERGSDDNSERADDDNSGPGSDNSGSDDDGHEVDDESESRGKGSGDDETTSDGSDDSGTDRSGDADDDSGQGGSSGSGSDNSGSSESGSSGSGSDDSSSGESSADDSSADDNSGSGSESDGEGSGSSGSDDEEKSGSSSSGGSGGSDDDGKDPDD